MSIIILTEIHWKTIFFALGDQVVALVAQWTTKFKIYVSVPVTDITGSSLKCFFPCRA